MLFIVFIDQHCKPESNILLIRVQGDGNSLPAYGLAEMNIEIPIKDTQQVQYGFPPESGIVRTVPKINCTTEAKKSLNFTPSQPNLEILPHIKEKSGVIFPRLLMVSKNIVLSILKKVIEKSGLTSRINTDCNGKTVTRSFLDIRRLTEKTSITAVPPVQTPPNPSAKYASCSSTGRAERSVYI